MQAVLMDAGPLVALLDRSDAHHRWAVAAMREVAMPVFICDAVLSEVCHLTRSLPGARATLERYVKNGWLVNIFDFATMAPRAMALMSRYASVPMSYADACLVMLSEQFAEMPVFTVDGDFLIYRRNGTERIPLLAPFAP